MTKEKKSKSAKAKKSKNKSKSKRSEVSDDALEGSEFDIEMRDAVVDHYDYEQDTVNDINDSTLNINVGETGNTKIDTSKSSTTNSNKMVLKLKFNLDSPPPTTKKHKHKHKHHREQAESSSHSHKKATGKRTTRDSSNDESDKNVDLFKEDDNKSSHVRKKAKRHHIDEKIEINGENRNIEKCSDSVKRHVDDKSKKTEKRSTNKANMNKSYTDNIDHGLIGDTVGKRLTDVDYMSACDKKGKTIKGVVKKVKVEKSQTLNDIKSKEIFQYSNNGEKLINYESANPVKSEIDGEFILGDEVIKGINHDSKELLMLELATNTSTYSLREKRSYPPVTEDTKTKADERSSSKAVKNTKVFCQSKCETSTEIVSDTTNVAPSISNETQSSIPSLQETTKTITSGPSDVQSRIISSDIATKEDTVMSTSVGKKGPTRKLGRPPKLQEPQQTLYYKSADKLWQFGEKAIERERDSILLEEERMKAMVISAGTEIGPRGNKPREARKQFAPDGSLIHNDPFTLIPQPPPFGETPLLTVISSKTQHYGPFATLGVDPPFFTPADKEYIYNMFGDEKGYAYAKSLKAFVADMGEDMNVHVDKIIDNLTFGVHSLDRQVSHILSNLDPNRPIDTSVIIQTELGPVNVGEEIERNRQLSEIKKQQTELDVWQKDKIDLDFLVSDQEIIAMTKSMGSDQQSFQKMLELNAQNLSELIKAKQGVGNLESQQKEKQLCM
ncbi:18645_t:CDS:2 [Racocetra fulgida]|uniref:18645_t:CDS:1 n=1 Tax=Racocetra fulgida TaxID=60492 RepID=A0A9N8WAY4_9GLOM|nr:18645_t:CDS:2 [Racocetra fulgida]